MKADRKDWSDFTIDAKEFTFLINQDKVVGKMKVVDAMNNPSLAGLINGSLNLKELAQAFPLEAVTLNDGYITTNMNIDATAEEMAAKNYRNMDFSGFLETKNVDMIYGDYPMTLASSRSTFSPREISTELTQMTIGVVTSTVRSTWRIHSHS